MANNVIHLSERRAAVAPDSREYFCRRCGARNFILLCSGEVCCAECEQTVDNIKAVPQREEIQPDGTYYRVQSDGHRMLCRADGTRSIFDDVDE